MNPLWIVLLGSITVLCLMLLRGKIKGAWIALVGLQFVGAGVLLYLLNGLGVDWGIYIPMNVLTLGLIAWLGLPGLLLVAALHNFVL